MPRCIVCNTRIYSSGYYCTLHRPYRRSRTQDYHNRSDDPAYASEIHVHTSAGARGAVIPHRRHDNDHNDTLALFNPIYSNTSIANTSRVHPVAQILASLQETHVIDYVTYNGQQVTVKANLEREQCPTCYVWFANRQKLDEHRWEYPVACDTHRMCMRREDAVWHATEKRHDRCFVRECEDLCRTEGGWEYNSVKRHIRRCHGPYQ